MYFKVDLDKLNEEWGKLNPPIPEQGNATFGKAETTNSLISNTENTAENTASTAEIFKTYENNIEMLNPIIADKIGDAIDTYPHQWILEAIEQSVTYGARNWKYIEKILKTWKAKGRSDTPLEKMGEVEKEMMRMDLKSSADTIAELGIGDISPEEQKERNAKFLAERKQK